MDHVRGTTLVLFFCAFTLAAGGCVGPAHQLDPLSPAEVADTIYVVDHGWHAGIVFAPSDTMEHLDLRNRLPARTRYVEVGWGDAGYYPNPDPGLWALLRAGLWPTTSVLHFIALDRPVQDYFPGLEIVRLYLSDRQTRRFNRFIYEAFRLEGPGMPEYVGDGLYPESAFFEASDTYHLFHNCNHWVAEALRAAGIPVRPAFALTRRQLMHQIRDLGTVIQRERP